MKIQKSGRMRTALVTTMNVATVTVVTMKTVTVVTAVTMGRKVDAMAALLRIIRRRSLGKVS